MPFFVVGLFYVISFVLIYLAPQRPFSIVLGPPIRAFWGERYLHYPYNLLLIPVLFSYAQIIVSAIIGVLMTGLVLGMLKEVKAGNRPQLLLNFVLALKKYFILFAIWLIVFIPATLVYRIPGFIPFNNETVLKVLPYLNFLIVILIELVFIYAPPAAIIEKKGLISSIKQGLLLSKNNFLTTLMLVLIPAVFYIPVIALRINSLVLMNRFFPEVVLIIIGLGIVLTVLMDCIITCSTAVLFLNRKERS